MESIEGFALTAAKRLSRKAKEFFQNMILILSPVCHCMLVVLATFLLVILPVALILTNLDVLGILWLPIFCMHWLFLSVMARQVYRYQEMQAERFIYGDELFFEAYPRMKKLEDRKKRFEAWRKSLFSRKNDY
jgi:hypothetical protein